MKTKYAIIIAIIVGSLIGASAYHFLIKTDKDTSELERQLSEAQIQISILQVEKTVLVEELEIIQVDLFTSQKELTELKQTHIDLLEQNLILEQRLNTSQTSLNDIEVELNKVKIEIASLRQELNRSSMPRPPTIVISWTKEEFWQELLEINISTFDVSGRFLKEEYHVTTKHEIQAFLDFIGNTEAYQKIPYSERQAKKKGHQVATRELFLLGKLLEWSEGKLAVGFTRQWYEMPGEWYDFIGKGERFLGIVLQENSQYVMYTIRAGPVPELVPLRLRTVIFIWM